ncbi:hypothetical protein V2O64_11860 [Verrucomicrobiaceae bacterium 227]
MELDCQSGGASLKEVGSSEPSTEGFDFSSPDGLLPFRTIEIARTSEGKHMVLQEKDGAYFLFLGGEMLMGGQYHGSEEALGTLGCLPLREKKGLTILIGGLGMGYTLRAVLDSVPDDAVITTAELSEAVIRWNHPEDGPLAPGSGAPLADARSVIARQDLCELIRESQPGAFDAILIDTDNEPHALSYEGNDALYSLKGLSEIKQALSPDGVLGFWFLEAPVEFDQRLQESGFEVTRHEVPCGEGGFHLIIIATPHSG